MDSGCDLQQTDISCDAATHWLHCQHCYCHGQVKEYWMPCVVLKSLPSNRVKVLVFGDRFWRGREHIKRVRYVDASRLVIIDG